MCCFGHSVQDDTTAAAPTWGAARSPACRGLGRTSEEGVMARVESTVRIARPVAEVFHSSLPSSPESVRRSGTRGSRGLKPHWNPRREMQPLIEVNRLAGLTGRSKFARAMPILEDAARAGTFELVPLLGLPLAHSTDETAFIVQRPVTRGAPQIGRLHRRSGGRHPLITLFECPSRG